MQQRFLLQIVLLAQLVSGTTMPIIRSSRVLYSGCCLWYFVLWFSSCWSGVELRVMCPVCRMLAGLLFHFFSFISSYAILWVQRRHNCSLAASFANCFMTLYLLKAHLQTFLSIPINQKCQILSCDNVVVNERYVVEPGRPPMKIRRMHIAWSKPKATNTYS